MPGGTDDLAFPDLDELRMVDVVPKRSKGKALAPSEDDVRDLYAAAAKFTGCPAEQTAVVVLAVRAGRGPEWVAAHLSDATTPGLDLERLLGATPLDRQALDLALLRDEDGEPLAGRCGHCNRNVDSTDPDHRVSSVMRGGRGVECVARGDIGPQHGGLLRA